MTNVKTNYSKPIFFSSPWGSGITQINGFTDNKDYFGIHLGSRFINNKLTFNEEFQKRYIFDARYISYSPTQCQSDKYDTEAIKEILNSGIRLENVPSFILKEIYDPQKETSKLVELIHKLESDELIIPKIIEPDDDNYEVGNDKWVPSCSLRDEIESEANCCLIIEGQPNRLSINYLRSIGINVRPGETDSFGWLTGVIDTKKGIIVFG